MSHYHFFVNAAIDSKGNARHWFRYLRKIIKNDQVIISQEDIEKLLNDKNLTMFQKITLKRATIIGTPTFNFASSLNKPAKKSYIVKLRKELHDKR